MTSESNTQNLRPLTAPAPVGVPSAVDRPVSGARKTLAGELRQQLADEIVRGVLPPGAALDETEMPAASRCRARPCARRSVNWQ